MPRFPFLLALAALALLCADADARGRAGGRGHRCGSSGVCAPAAPPVEYLPLPAAPPVQLPPPVAPVQLPAPVQAFALGVCAGGQCGGGRAGLFRRR